MFASGIAIVTILHGYSRQCRAIGSFSTTAGLLVTNYTGTTRCLQMFHALEGGPWSPIYYSTNTQDCLGGHRPTRLSNLSFLLTLAFGRLCPRHCFSPQTFTVSNTLSGHAFQLPRAPVNLADILSKNKKSSSCITSRCQLHLAVFISI